MVNKEHQDLSGLLSFLGHKFRDESLLREALTHPSIHGLKRSRHKKKTISAYERLEFLGDRVLGLVIAHWLYELYPEAAEGSLAKRHASLVNREALRKVGLTIGLETFLRHVQEDDDARTVNLTAISDATEGVIGALYLDGGLSVAEKFIKKYWENAIKSEAEPADPKTTLQEFVQARGLPLPVYREIKRTGPAHAPCFSIEVTVKGYPAVEAEGQSKREAEKLAARSLIEKIIEQ